MPVGSTERGEENTGILELFIEDKRAMGCLSVVTSNDIPLANASTPESAPFITYCGKVGGGIKSQTE